MDIMERNTDRLIHCFSSLNNSSIFTFKTGNRDFSLNAIDAFRGWKVEESESKGRLPFVR